MAKNNRSPSGLSFVHNGITLCGNLTLYFENRDFIYTGVPSFPQFSKG